MFTSHMVVFPTEDHFAIITVKENLKEVRSCYVFSFKVEPYTPLTSPTFVGTLLPTTTLE